MRRLLPLIALALALVAGCKKAKPTDPAGGSGVGAHAPTGVVTNPGTGGGGSGGAVQAVRKAAGRAVSQNELNNIRQFMETASSSSATGDLPTREQVVQILQREAPATHKLVQEGAIVLTGAKKRESVWAYTSEAQSVTGQHLVVNNSGVQRMTAQELKQALQRVQ